MKTCFSTLGCPDRSWAEVIETAKTLPFDGVEWRLVDGEFIGPDFSLDQAARIRDATQRAGLVTSAVDSSLELARPPGHLRTKVVADAMAMLDVARRFDADWLRVFVGPLEPSLPLLTAIEWMSDILCELDSYAAQAGVRLAIETHSIAGNHTDIRVDGVTCSRFLSAVLTDSRVTNCHIQWDLGNTLMEGESPAATWEIVRPWLAYVQVKDLARGPDGGWNNVAPGSGEVPIQTIVEWLELSDFDGWLSFEWEKWWHPDLPALDTVLADFLRAVAPGRAEK